MIQASDYDSFEQLHRMSRNDYKSSSSSSSSNHSTGNIVPSRADSKVNDMRINDFLHMYISFIKIIIYMVLLSKMSVCVDVYE